MNTVHEIHVFENLYSNNFSVNDPSVHYLSSSERKRSKILLDLTLATAYLRS